MLQTLPPRVPRPRPRTPGEGGEAPPRRSAALSFARSAKLIVVPRPLGGLIVVPVTNLVLCPLAGSGVSLASSPLRIISGDWPVSNFMAWGVAGGGITTYKHEVG